MTREQAEKRVAGLSYEQMYALNEFLKQMEQEKEAQHDTGADEIFP